jgi:hypothetical protein
MTDNSSASIGTVRSLLPFPRTWMTAQQLNASSQSAPLGRDTGTISRDLAVHTIQLPRTRRRDG